MADSRDEHVHVQRELGPGDGLRPPPPTGVVLAQLLACQLDSCHLSVPQHAHGIGQKVKLDALFLGRLDLFHKGGHISASTAIDHRHLTGFQPPGRARRVDGRIATAHDHDLLALQVGRLAQGDIAQELGAVVDALLVLARDTQLAALVSTDGQDHCAEAVLLQ